MIVVAPKENPGPASSGDNANSDRIYLVIGTADQEAALQALQANVPATITAAGGVQYLKLCTVEYNSPESWTGTARYEQRKDENNNSWSFDTSGGTQHITQSIKNIGNYACGTGGAVRDHKGAIGATKDGVEGVDITVPVYSFSETWVFADSAVTDAYKGILFALTGKTANAAFKGCAIGECLFCGAAGSKRGDGNWEITFKFAASPNVADVCADWAAAVKPSAAVAKKGWEYVWVEYETRDQASPPCLVQIPICVHVEQVYRAGDFSTMGIGT